MIPRMTEAELASALRWFVEQVDSGKLSAPPRLLGQLEGAAAALEVIGTDAAEP